MSRKHTLLLFLLGCCTALSAQLTSTDTPPSVPAQIQADQMPYFSGCSALPEGSMEKRACSNQTLVTFISKNLEMPANSEETGTVYVQFSVNEKGKVVDSKIMKGLSAAHNESALKVVNAIPDWEPARKDNQSVSVIMTLPIRFMKKDESEFSNGFRLTWGKLAVATTTKEALQKLLQTPITVRDDVGNALEINELLFERDRAGKFADATSNGTITPEMQGIVKKLKSGDVFTVTATVQKKGQFYYVEKTYKIE